MMCCSNYDQLTCEYDAIAHSDPLFTDQKRLENSYLEQNIEEIKPTKNMQTDNVELVFICWGRHKYKHKHCIIMQQIPCQHQRIYTSKS